MKKVRFLARYSAKGLCSQFSSINDLVSRYSYCSPDEFQLRSIGFSGDPISGSLTSTGGDFFLTELTVAERIVPPQLVNAHYEEKLTETRLHRSNLTKVEKDVLRAQIRQDLALKTPPTVNRIPVAFLVPNEELWLLCNTKAAADKVLADLVGLCKEQNLCLAPAPSVIQNATLKQFLMSSSSNDVQITRQVVTSGAKGRRRITHDFDDGPIPVEELNELIDAMPEVLECGIQYNNTLRADLCRSGHLHRIMPLGDLNEEVYAAGDPVNWQDLGAVISGIWISAVMSLIQATSETASAA